MQKRPITNILKSRPKRTVYRALEPLAGMDAPIIKRFHAPGVLQGWRDRLRARREAKGLRRWRALGLPAPAPITIRRSAGHWELVLEAIPGARPLPQFLTEERLFPSKLKVTAHRVGKLLADLDRSGAHHGDPHPGNLLIDDQNMPWLIDPTPSPLFSDRAAPGRDRWVRFCAQVRELSSPLFRAQVVAAYREANGPSPAPSSEADRGRMELEAREWRCKEARVRTQRWLRTSGATQVEGNTIHHLSIPDGSCRRHTFNSHAQAQATWLTYARLHEHGVPSLHAKAFHSSPDHAVESVVPEGAQANRSTPSAAQLGHLLGCLHDRGLHVIDFSMGALYTDACGNLLLDPAGIRFEDRPATSFLAPEIPDKTPRSDARFIEAFLSQQGCTREQSQELKRVLQSD